MTIGIESLRESLLALFRRFGKQGQPVSITIAAREPITAIKPEQATLNAYAYTNSRGKTYYLHSRRGALQHHDAPIYFFRREVQDGALPTMPAGYYVHETPNGMPVLRKAAAA